MGQVLTCPILFSRIGTMQTFLPEADFAETAKHLDRKRLIKQSVENLQVLKSLAGYYDESGAWVNHPAVKMWRGHEDWLFLYNEAIIREIVLRGYKNSTHIQFDEIYEENFLGLESDEPWWLHNQKLHYTHKGRLFEKDPTHYYFYGEFADYREMGYTCCTKCNYFWPTHVEAL
jgi:hypothetical protein